jgi:precorrin-6A/cobalt-precorrin-6A reductase
MTATKARRLRVLLLGGTSEASLLAKLLASTPDIEATLSLAGRTANPLASPIRLRVGGFGGITGLAEYLTRERIDLVVDATHPFAARISNNAIAACTATGVPLLAIERPLWTPTTGDDWHEHDTVEAAIAALPEPPQRIFSALGRQSMAALCAAPQHHYVIRVIDPIPPPRELPRATIVTARGPFRTEDDVALFRENAIECVLAKNSGGRAAYAKLEAARHLGLKVYMIRRPEIAKRPVVNSVEDVVAWIATHHPPLAERGV